MKPNLKALKAIADYLRSPALKHKKQSFDMGNWRCNTSACAIGHTIHLKEVRETGLRLKPRKDLHGFNWGRDNLVPTFEENEGDVRYAFKVVGKAFGIGTKQAENLFGCRLYNHINTEDIPPEEVACRIEKYICRQERKCASTSTPSSSTPAKK